MFTYFEENRKMEMINFCSNVVHLCGKGYSDAYPNSKLSPKTRHNLRKLTNMFGIDWKNIYKICTKKPDNTLYKDNHFWSLAIEGKDIYGVKWVYNVDGCKANQTYIIYGNTKKKVSDIFYRKLHGNVPLSFYSWFDPSNIEHLRIFKYFIDNNKWNKVPKDIFIEDDFDVSLIVTKIASYYMFKVLGQGLRLVQV